MAGPSEEGFAMIPATQQSQALSRPVRPG